MSNEKVSIGSFVRNLVKENLNTPNKELLDKVLQEFPNAKTSMACIAWYKSDMRKKGLIPTKWQMKEAKKKEDKALEETTQQEQNKEAEAQLVETKEAEAQLVETKAKPKKVRKSKQEVAA